MQLIGYLWWVDEEPTFIDYDEAHRWGDWDSFTRGYRVVRVVRVWPGPPVVRERTDGMISDDEAAVCQPFAGIRAHLSRADRENWPTVVVLVPELAQLIREYDYLRSKIRRRSAGST